MIQVVPYRKRDKEAIIDMLATEGIPRDEMVFEQCLTYIMKDQGETIGFFSIRQEHGLPSLQHFCVNRAHRSAKNARLLVKAFEYIIREMGFRKAILHGCQYYVKKLIEYYFKCKPYAFKGERAYYLVEVRT